MKIHEYQAKQILSQHGVRIPRGEVATTPGRGPGDRRENRPRVVVKAQIHAGGRGKAGGVKPAGNPAEAEPWPKMMGMTLVTHQTGPEDKSSAS